MSRGFISAGRDALPRHLGGPAVHLGAASHSQRSMCVTIATIHQDFNNNLSRVHVHIGKMQAAGIRSKPDNKLGANSGTTILCL